MLAWHENIPLLGWLRLGGKCSACGAKIGTRYPVVEFNSYDHDGASVFAGWTIMGDGSAAYTKALGLEFDLTAKGLGLRCQRFSMLVDNGVVKVLNIEAPGKYEISDAETLLRQMG